MWCWRTPCMQLMEVRGATEANTNRLVGVDGLKR
jgi:hypothetical protein